MPCRRFYYKEGITGCHVKQPVDISRCSSSFPNIRFFQLPSQVTRFQIIPIESAPLSTHDQYIFSHKRMASSGLIPLPTYISPDLFAGGYIINSQSVSSTGIDLPAVDSQSFQHEWQSVKGQFLVPTSPHPYRHPERKGNLPHLVQAPYLRIGYVVFDGITYLMTPQLFAGFSCIESKYSRFPSQLFIQ